MFSMCLENRCRAQMEPKSQAWRITRKAFSPAEIKRSNSHHTSAAVSSVLVKLRHSNRTSQLGWIASPFFLENKHADWPETVTYPWVVQAFCTPNTSFKHTTGDYQLDSYTPYCIYPDDCWMTWSKDKTTKTIHNTLWMGIPCTPNSWKCFLWLNLCEFIYMWPSYRQTSSMIGSSKLTIAI